MLKLSKRLFTVARQVDNCRTLADIGCDHGYLPIYLYKNNIIEKAFCCDKSRGSLEKAAANILIYGLEENIMTVLGDGLQNIGDDALDAIVIAGMGGLLINRILEAEPKKVSLAGQLILQPQLHIDKVRRFIHTIGFKISNEEMIFEDGKYYTIIKCEKGADEKYSEAEYLTGKILINKKCAVLKEFLLNEIMRIEALLNTVENGDRRLELKNLYGLYEEVLKCI